MSSITSQEGFVSVSGGRVWYRIAGSGPGMPLLILHGGPGAGSDYLEPLEALGGDRPVVFYDQLGCGKSDQPDDPTLWRLDRFVKEVEEVRQGLDLKQIHLFGQSWGGLLAIEYLLASPAGVQSLILASSGASMREYEEHVRVLVSGLPTEHFQAILEHEKNGEFSHPNYQTAAFEFAKRHLCRLDPWPDPLLRTGKNITGNLAYEIIQGPSEFTITGNIKGWDRSARLGEIVIPTLITVGRYDEVTPECAETLHQGILGSQLVIFENSAHMAQLEETEKYIETLRGFLNRIEQ